MSTNVATQNKSNTAGMSKVRFITQVGMLGAIAVILMAFEIPLPFAPAFYKIDFSEVPALIGCFAMGPAAGMAQIAIMIPTTSVTIKVAENSLDAPSLSRLPSMFPTAMEPPIPRQ